MGDDRIDLNIIRDRFYGLLIENRSLVRPVIGYVFYMIPDILLHPLASVYAGGPADAHDMMFIGRDDAVIRYGAPSCVMDSFLVEISGIVMITPNENHPIVGFPQPVGHFDVGLLIVPRFIKTKPAVPGDY